MLTKVKTALMHYGTPHEGSTPHSGRYKWGSGETPFQRPKDFRERVEKLRREGMADKDIAKSLGLSLKDMRAQMSLARSVIRGEEIAMAKQLRDEGKTLKEIAKIMGYANDSSIRSLLNASSEAKMNEAQNTADFLREQIETRGMIDVGVGAEAYLNISRTRLEQVLYILEMEGYPVYKGGIPQATNPGQQTNQMVIGPKDSQYKDIYDFENVSSIQDFISSDGGDTFHSAFQYPESMDSSRLLIRYAEEGGLAKDGVIELRPGVEDLSLGDSHYSQVRILVDGTHYLKGMAFYGEETDFPPGVDVIFNTNKAAGTPMEKVLKEITNDPNNPFGSLIKEHGGQSTYIGEDGQEHLRLINKRSDEGDWSDWSDTISSQFLSKQPLRLIKQQLTVSMADKDAELAEICSLTNPTVKKRLLMSFADDCDAAAVHLQAAALPRQSWNVILPLTSIKDNEVYAPNYRDGETVALVRFPHGGTFEIPILKVNNKNDEGKKVVGNALDAVGINKIVADRLSGADFDGDTVLVIPTGGKIKIQSTSALKGLEGFDPKLEYGGKEEGTFHVLTKGAATQKQMGSISNLITDMTLKGATEDELARAVRHSMVVIDAAKHKLDYKQSEIDNGIAELREKYQGYVTEDGTVKGGASTLISRAKAEVSVSKRKGSPHIDPETGELVYKVDENRFYTTKSGKTKERTQKSTQMMETKDPYTLSSGTAQEDAYAEYASHMKSLANQARKEVLTAGRIKYSASANKTYAQEVSYLTSQLNQAIKNAPKERQAQRIANSVVAAKVADNSTMTKAEKKKISQQALTAARVSVGASRTTINITPKSWEAIQSGAISENMLSKILNHTDVDSLRKYATPKTSKGLSQSKVNLAKALYNSGYTMQKIADRLGVSVTTIRNAIRS